MITWQGVLLGIEIALTPGMVVLALLLAAPRGTQTREKQDRP